LHKKQHAWGGLLAFCSFFLAKCLETMLLEPISAVLPFQASSIIMEASGSIIHTLFTRALLAKNAA